MYNLHTHTLLSDGSLIPSEVAVRYLDKGYKVIAITDHADYCNIKLLTEAVVRFSNRWPKTSGITILPGIELTHIPPEQFKPLAKYARTHGIILPILSGFLISADGQTPRPSDILNAFALNYQML